jgi:hypothetical protein
MAEGGSEQPVSPWLRLWSIGLALTVASVGTVLVFALVLHGSFLDGVADLAARFLQAHPVIQALLACSPLIAALALGFAMGRRRKRRLAAEALAESRQEAGLDP